MEVGNKLYSLLHGYTVSYNYTLDGIIIGGSSLQHITDNLDAANDGPLDPSKKYWSLLPLILQ